MGYRVVGAVAALGLALVTSVGTAGAHGNGQEVDFVCDDGVTYRVEGLTQSDNRFVPFSEVNTDQVLVPLYYGPTSATVTAPDGSSRSFIRPAEYKGQSLNAAKKALTCTYAFSKLSDGSEGGVPAGSTYSASGTVVVKLVASGQVR